MNKILISTSVLLCGLSSFAAGREWQDDYGQHSQGRKAPAQAVDPRALELAIELERLKLATQKEKTRTAEAEARAASAISHCRPRVLPTKVSNWTSQDYDEALKRANAGDYYLGAAIGMVHEFGCVGRPINLQRAAKAYRAAFQAGNMGAKMLLKRVEQKMDEEED